MSAVIRFPSRRLFVALVMFAGLAFCIVALRQLNDARSLCWHFAAIPSAIGVISGIASLIASALSWQRYLTAFSGVSLTFSESFSQVGLILVGKYVPGKVGGALARVSANNGRASATAVVGATLLEQLGALTAALMIGASCLVYSWMPLAILPVVVLIASILLAIPLVAARAIMVLTWVQSRLRRKNAFFFLALKGGNLRSAWLLQLLQWLSLAIFAAAVVELALPETTFLQALKLSGFFAIAVIVGVAAFVFPGGIGPREASFVWLAGSTVGYDAAAGLAFALRLAMSGIDLVAGLGTLLNWIIHVFRSRSSDAP